MNESKKRTRVACETCRRKKIKCNGEHPCSNCLLLKDEFNCKYVEKMKKERLSPRENPVKRISNAKAMRLMEDRMSKIEGIIFNISDKLDLIHDRNSNSTRTSNHKKGSRNNVADSGSDYYDDEDDGDDEEDDENDDEDEEGIKHEEEEADEESEVREQNQQEQIYVHKRRNLWTDRWSSKKHKAYILGSSGLKNHTDTDNQNGYSQLSHNETETDSFNGNSSDTRSQLVGVSVPKKADRVLGKNSHRGSEVSVTCDDLDSKADKDFFVHTLGEKFFESHSFLSVCSQKSMEWIAKSLAPDKQYILQQFDRFPSYYYSRARRQFIKWVQPAILTPKTLVQIAEKPLLKDAEYIHTLLEFHLLSLQHLDMVVSRDLIKLLLAKYYSGKRLTSSQYLILVSSVHLAISGKLGRNLIYKRKSASARNKPNVNTKAQILDRISESELFKFQESLVDSAVHHYQRICIIGQGLETIQAIIMLCVALEGVADVDYMLLSVAVRYAQEIGLHRPESYLKLSPTEKTIRKRLWIACQQMDIEFSFRNGKPPVLNYSDITRSSLNDINFIIELLQPYVAERLPLNLTYNEKLQTYDLESVALKFAYDNNSYEFILWYFVYLLSRVRAKSYSMLFASVGNLKTLENLENILEELNNDMLYVCNSVNPEFRPKFYDEPGFFENIDAHNGETKEELIEINFTFFFHLTLTNRVPFMIDVSAENEKIATFRKIHIRSARTLLHLSLRIEIDDYKNFSLNWISFYPFAAFLMLLSNCMNNPFHPETVTDIDLLREVSNEFFDLRQINLVQKGHILKSAIATIIMKLFVELVVAVVESRTNTKLTSNAQHNEQWGQLRKAAPEIFDLKRTPIIGALQIKTSFDLREDLSTSNSLNSSGAPSNISYHASPNTDPAAYSLLNSNNGGLEGIPGSNQQYSPSSNPALANLVNPMDEARQSNESPRISISPSRAMSQSNFDSGNGGNSMRESPVLVQGQRQVPEAGSGIAHNNNSFSNGTGSSSSSQASPDFFGIQEMIDHESIGNLVNYQVNQLPNFFYDNNLGF